jgi:hypothetical protein
VSLGDGAVRDRPVGGDDARLRALDAGAEDPGPGVLGLLHHRVGGPAQLGQVLLRDVVHRAVVERDRGMRAAVSDPERRAAPQLPADAVLVLLSTEGAAR